MWSVYEDWGTKYFNRRIYRLFSIFSHNPMPVYAELHSNVSWYTWQLIHNTSHSTRQCQVVAVPGQAGVELRGAHVAPGDQGETKIEPGELWYSKLRSLGGVEGSLVTGWVITVEKLPILYNTIFKNVLSSFPCSDEALTVCASSC